jgi:hypothetical protein
MRVIILDNIDEFMLTVWTTWIMSAPWSWSLSLTSRLAQQ